LCLHAFYDGDEADVGVERAAAIAVMDQAAAEQSPRTCRNVKDYGAVGDGIHDDTDAILAALNAPIRVAQPEATEHRTDGGDD